MQSGREMMEAGKQGLGAWRGICSQRRAQTRAVHTKASWRFARPLKLVLARRFGEGKQADAQASHVVVLPIPHRLTHCASCNAQQRIGMQLGEFVPSRLGRTRLPVKRGPADRAHFCKGAKKKKKKKKEKKGAAPRRCSACLPDRNSPIFGARLPNSHD